MNLILSRLFHLTLGCTMLALAACGGGSGGSSGGVDDAAKLAAIDAQFPAPTSGSLNTVYECTRTGSALYYYLYLRPDGALDWQFTANNNQTFQFSGSYSYTNNAITLQIVDPGFPLNETTTAITTHLGLVYTMLTPQMGCIAIGHGYDISVSPVNVAVSHYQCPYVSQGAGSDVENAIELGAANVGGSIFRQRDTWPTGSASAIIRRGYGVYRRVGNEIYGYFNNAFDDFNVLTGTLTNGDAQLQITELGSAGVCNLQ